jgi:hypothetical protein
MSAVAGTADIATKLLTKDGVADRGEYCQAAIDVAAVTLPSRAILRRAVRGYSRSSSRSMIGHHRSDDRNGDSKGDKYPTDGVIAPCT